MRPVRVGPPTGPVRVTGGRGSLALPRSLVRPLLLVLRNEAVGIEDGGVVLARVTLEGKAPRPGPRGANCARGATDYVRAYPQLIAFYVDAPYTALGTGSFERSDTLSALPHFFEVDIRHVASQRSRRKDRFCARKSRKELPATA